MRKKVISIPIGAVKRVFDDPAHRAVDIFQFQSVRLKAVSEFVGNACLDYFNSNRCG